MEEFILLDIQNLLPHRRGQGIYAIRNKVNNKCYVGSAAFVANSQRIKRSMSLRLQEHFRDLNNNQHHNIYLQRSWNKHGANNFEFLLIEEFFGDYNILLEREQHWIDRLKSADPNFGFNICAAAGSMFGFKHSEETKEKLRKLSGSRRHTEETKRKMSAWQIGKKLSEETKRKISLSEKGKIIPPELRKRWSEARKGRLHSEEAKKVMTLNARTRKLNPDDVIEIRKLHEMGVLGFELAAKYNVTATNISCIIKRKTWKHIK